MNNENKTPFESEDKIRKERLEKALRMYSQAMATYQYSVGNYRLINNVTDDEWKWLTAGYEGLINLIITKANLNIRNRLLDPEITSAQVSALRSLLDLEAEHSANKGTQVINNLHFISTNKELEVMKESNEDLKEKYK